MIYHYIKPLPFDLETDGESFWDQERRQAFSRLVKNTGATTVIEVGSWKGKSTLDIAQMLPENGKVFSVDHWLGWEKDGTNTYKDPKLPYIHHQFLSNVIHANLTHKIIPIRMSNKEAAKALNIKADIIFFDEEIPLSEDFDLWLPYLNDNGVMCTFLYGGSFSQELEQLITKKNLESFYDGDFCCYGVKLPEEILKK